MTELISAAMGPGGGGHGGGGHGGGGEEETVSNNLSYPVIFTDGIGLTLAGVANQYAFTTPYDLNGDGAITAGNWDPVNQTGGDQIGGYYQFAQKVTGNTWQSDSLLIPADEDPATNLFVSTIDWGDSIEGGKPIAIGNPTRIEISFYKNLGTPLVGDVALDPTMTSYPMQLLANPSSPTEVQGASATAYPLAGGLPNGDVLTLDSSEASVYAHTAKLALQSITGAPEADDFLWNGDYWVDADLNDAVTIAAPIGGLTFGGEITVSGKVVYGLSMGGWRPDHAGTYRATVYFPEAGNLQLDAAEILASTESTEAVEAMAAAEGGGEEPPTDTITGAQIDGLHNLTYLDLFVEGNQPPVVQPIVLSKTEDDPDFTVSLISTATDLEADALTAANVVVVASDGSNPVALPAGTAEVQGSNLLIRPSLLNSLASGQQVIIQASFSVSDGTNLVPSTATITVAGLEESTSPPSGGGSSGSSGGGGVTPPGGGVTTPSPITAESPKDPANEDLPQNDPPQNDPPQNDPPQDDPHQFMGTPAADRIKGTSADDRIIGGAGNDRLQGRKGHDTLIGDGGNDVLIGDKGDDVLDGGAGNDDLRGGLGVDDLTGGGGRDTFRLRLKDIGAADSQPDRIRDFDLSRDRLHLDSGISRQMLSFGDGLLMVQARNQEMVLAQLGSLNGISEAQLLHQIQLV